ncbi:ParA family protein [Vibrio cyclitrophicus]|uniref:ParA family protein n=1 Tax=Vibrio cyclitrophicus TaxID=47951 RepID=UPI00067F163E|nr:ParA family protein [Vibrio cyclitrophicus]KNH12767.1 hypothetical protein ACS79_10900 [Vibrio lentus]OBT14152.1 hypothetical protein A9265_03910 [Vibrio cyclitrophicus]PME27946.1 hypothetical protein BCV41_03290 [Vibrio cyclitrophicus]
MRVVIAQHKGGVGKTTLAVHVAATLSAGRFNKTVIVDCDSQGDAFRFFTSSFPETPLEVKQGMDNVDAIWNPERDKFSTRNTFSEYTHIVVDVDTRIINALQVIREAKPDVVLIPVDNQRLSITHGNHVLQMINEEVGSFAYPVKVVFVEMGYNWNLTGNVYTIPYLKEFDDCINDSDYIWNAGDNFEYMAQTFKGLIDYVK